MKISDKGIELIKSFEGLVLDNYKCQSGHWTIGYGHKQDVCPLEKITKETAELLLREDIKIFEKCVNDSIKVPLQQNEFDALVSLAFNIGSGSFKQSKSVTKNINNGRKDLAAQGFEAWCKITVNGIKQVSKGLLNRRKKERDIFENGYR